jgi:hypothetical protein
MALLRCITCVIMSSGACVFPPRINAYCVGWRSLCLCIGRKYGDR